MFTYDALHLHLVRLPSDGRWKMIMHGESRRARWNRLTAALTELKTRVAKIVGMVSVKAHHFIGITAFLGGSALDGARSVQTDTEDWWVIVWPHHELTRDNLSYRQFFPRAAEKGRHAPNIMSAAARRDKKRLMYCAGQKKLC